MSIKNKAVYFYQETWILGQKLGERLGRLGPGKGDIRLETLIDMNHDLVILSKELDWKWLEAELSPFYADQGRPSVPIRKIAGLLILKQLFNESDESVIAR